MDTLKLIILLKTEVSRLAGRTGTQYNLGNELPSVTVSLRLAVLVTEYSRLLFAYTEGANKNVYTF